MRWFACPENKALQLRVTPRLASWNKAGDPDQVRLREYLDDTEVLLSGSRVDGPWALRLDVGLPAARDLLDAADLDNFAYPLAYRIGDPVKDPGLVSVWCTKQHNERSFVRIDVARDVPAPSSEILIAKTTASASSSAYKEQIYAAVAGQTELEDGPVGLELSFVVGARRNWLNLWKQTIDSLDPLLGSTYPDRAWHPRDGRITELGMHVNVDPAAGNDVVVGIHAQGPPTNARLDGSVILHDEVSTNAYADRVRQFRGDDAGYLVWLTDHPDGYVINIARGYYATTARVHQADCRTISGRIPRGDTWTGPYVKVCADRLSDLDEWATKQVGVTIVRCGTCNPLSDGACPR